MKYNLIDRTPKEMQYCVEACPAVYELTPEENPIIFVEALPEAEKFYKKIGFEEFENPVDGREFMFYGGGR